MSARNRNFEMDMCSGPLLGKIIAFSLPMIATTLLQLFYNMADTIVVGRYAGETALAAVGSTASLISLLINLFLGMSVGTSVIVARNYGAGNFREVNNSLHTSVALSAIFGVGVAVVGIAIARPMLELMGSPEDVIDQATLYLQIYLLGLPAMMIYNFASAAMRAIGDTRRPLFYLAVSGVVNVLLNLFFVIVFDMGVAGVAWATSISQVVALVMIVHRLLNCDNCIRLEIKNIRIQGDHCKEIVRIGLPAGLQSTMFSISNVLIQSSINSFGSTVMAANAAAQNLDAFNSAITSALNQAALTFTGQNIGARRYDRIGRILYTCIPLTIISCLVLGVGIYAFGPMLLPMYTDQAEVIEFAMIRLRYISIPYFMGGLMDVLSSMLRGCGYSLMPMIVTVVGVCVFRVVWLFTAFAANPTLEVLYSSYVVSWTLTSIVHVICLVYVLRFKLPKANRPDAAIGR